MALTGLEIFKLLPKTNCKKCGMPTCLAFAMQLAQKKAELDKCPFVSDEAKQALAAAAAPPMRQVVFGAGDSQVKIGQETVLFRHEEKFYSPTVIGVTVSDSLEGDALTARIEALKVLQFDRVGTHIGIGAVAVVNDSGSPEKFAEVAQKAQSGTGLALILRSSSAKAMAAAVAKTAAKTPLLAGATEANLADMAKIAAENKCPLVIEADSPQGLSDLSEAATAAGVQDLVLCLGGLDQQQQLYSQTRVRMLALRKGYRPLGHPTISFVTEGDSDKQTATAASLICKYSGVVVVDTTEPAALLPMLTVVMNIYTDPQKPVQVQPKVYEIGEPGPDAPVMFTTNFSLTYYTLESDVEASRVPSHILVVDTEGTSVLTAYSGDKLNEKVVADAIAKFKVEDMVSHRKLIIPGYVAVMSGKLEEATGWEVLVGPRECSMLPKYLQEVWK